MYKIFLCLICSAFLLTSCGEDAPSKANINNESQAKPSEQLQETKQDGPKESSEEKEEAKNITSENNLVILENDIILGDKSSNLVFIEYFAPTCPHCALYHRTIFLDIKKKYIDTNKIAYVMREFISNKQDLDASILAHCGGGEKNYINFMNVILRQQDSWAYSKNYREILTNISTLGGISPEKYATCLNNEDLIDKVVKPTQIIAKNPEFVGTPTFFINGKIAKKYTFEEISEAIDEELKNNAK